MPETPTTPPRRVASVVVPIRPILIGLLIINASIGIIYLAITILEWSGVVLPQAVREFLGRWNVDAEVTLPAFYSALLLAAAGLLALAVGVLGRSVRQPRWGWWIAVAIVLIGLAADEASAFHEIAARPVQRLLAITEGPLLFAWVVPALVIVIITVTVFARFYVGLPADTRLLAGVGAFLFVLGALGMEMLQGALVYQLAPPGQETSFSLELLAGVEELLEMTGAVLIIVAFLRHLGRHVLEPIGAALHVVERGGGAAAA